jgi:hypothetical protein
MKLVVLQDQLLLSLIKFFHMAIVDLSHVQFWQPPLNSTSSKHTASQYIRKNGRSGLAASSRTQPALPRYREDEIRKHSAQFTPQSQCLGTRRVSLHSSTVMTQLELKVR